MFDGFVLIVYVFLFDNDDSMLSCKSGGKKYRALVPRHFFL